MRFVGSIGIIAVNPLTLRVFGQEITRNETANGNRTNEPRGVVSGRASGSNLRG